MKIEFQELISYCDVTEAELQSKKTFQKEYLTFQSLIFIFFSLRSQNFLRESLEIAKSASVTSQKRLRFTTR